MPTRSATLHRQDSCFVKAFSSKAHRRNTIGTSTNKWMYCSSIPRTLARPRYVNKFSSTTPTEAVIARCKADCPTTPFQIHWPSRPVLLMYVCCLTFSNSIAEKINTSTSFNGKLAPAHLARKIFKAPPVCLSSNSQKLDHLPPCKCIVAVGKNAITTATDDLLHL